MPRQKKVAIPKIDNSNMRIDAAIGPMAMEAFDIYRDMLNASKIFNNNICSLCKDGQRKPIHFHGSEFGSCYREVQYNLVNPKAYFNTDNLKNIFLYDGHLHEEAAIKLLLAANYKISAHDKEVLIKRNIPLRDKNYEIIVSCHPDLLLDLPNGQRFLLEFKALKDWGIKNKFQQNLIPKVYYGQCQIYMEALNIDYTLLMFKSRHTSEIFPPFIIKRNPVYIQQRFNFLAGILASTSALEVVPKEYANKDCDACKFCAYYNACWT